MDLSFFKTPFLHALMWSYRGKETIEQLIELDPDVRAIVCSGYSQDSVMANYRAFGFQAKLVKPFQFHELHALIASILRSGRR